MDEVCFESKESFPCWRRGKKCPNAETIDYFDPWYRIELSVRGSSLSAGIFKIEVSLSLLFNVYQGIDNAAIKLFAVMVCLN